MLSYPLLVSKWLCMLTSVILPACKAITWEHLDLDRLLCHAGAPAAYKVKQSQQAGPASHQASRLCEQAFFIRLVHREILSAQ